MTTIVSLTQCVFYLIMLKWCNSYEFDYFIATVVFAERLRPHALLIGCDFDWFCHVCFGQTNCL